MQSIADISIFKTPFESAEAFSVRFERIKTMFEDYIVNAGMNLDSITSENEHYITKQYFDTEKRLVNITFSFQKNFSETSSYFPAGMINYTINPFVFQKENVESFLNDNIAFIWNVFSTEFFIDYHSDYTIDDRNKGKKIDYNKLGKFDMENPKSEANKQILDSLMYIYFGLVKNIYNLENNSEKLDQFLKNTTLSEASANFELFSKRGDATKDALVKQASIIKAQIDTFIQLVS